MVRSGITAILCLLLAFTVEATPRIRFEAKINGQDVTLAFDTGTETFVLFETAVQALGLKFTNPPADQVVSPGKVGMGITEFCDLEMGGGKTTGRFAVYKTPPYLTPDVDGLLPWKAFRGRLLYLNAHAEKLSPLAALPDDIGDWNRWDLKTDAETLFFEIRKQDGTTARIHIDTGTPGGVELYQTDWQVWRSGNPDAPASLRAIFTPSRGLQVLEECWAEKLDLGNFTISNVPVSADSHATHFLHKDYTATFGLYALTRFEIILDYSNDAMYTRPINAPPGDYPHSRIAAVFVPENPATDHDLVAHVLPEGPACRAGIRNGDILLRIDDLDVTPWRTTPGIRPLSRFWSQPAGTKITLGLMRDGKPFEVTVVLEDILPPAGGDA